MIIAEGSKGACPCSPRYFSSPSCPFRLWMLLWKEKRLGNIKVVIPVSPLEDRALLTALLLRPRPAPMGGPLSSPLPLLAL